ncbi:MAG: DUF441 domain-containing protein [Selenomonadaceae bacterium]|nr:DUF441 domain-containing protein [Selenomonadaceae bacterium]
MMSEYLTLIFVLILSIVGHNNTVIYAAVLVLILKIAAQLSGQPQVLEWMGSHGLNLGIIVLTAAVLVPIADGTVTLQTIIDSFKTPIGIVAVIAGLLAAISGGAGVPLMQTNPNVIPALIVGTMAGVFFFKGIAVGPLIAAGFTYFVMALIEHFK